MDSYEQVFHSEEFLKFKYPHTYKTAHYIDEKKQLGYIILIYKDI